MLADTFPTFCRWGRLLRELVSLRTMQRIRDRIRRIRPMTVYRVMAPGGFCIFYLGLLVGAMINHFRLPAWPFVVSCAGLAIGAVASWRVVRTVGFRWHGLWFLAYVFVIGTMVLDALSEPWWIVFGWKHVLETGRWL